MPTLKSLPVLCAPECIHNNCLAANNARKCTQHNGRHAGCRTCVVYGALPPETRRQQARLFNEPDNEFDVMVASDAVGMGLNLNIRRIIFNSLSKFEGVTTKQISVSEIKQIAGTLPSCFSARCIRQITSHVSSLGDQIETVLSTKSSCPLTNLLFMVVGG